MRLRFRLPWTLPTPSPLLQMIGMNADALFRVSSGLLHFFERVGAAIFELSSFISATPPVDANGACFSSSLPLPSPLPRLETPRCVVSCTRATCNARHATRDMLYR